MLKPRINGPRENLIDGEALFEAVCSEPVLAKAWAKVRANKGVSGGDGETIGQYALNWKSRNRTLIGDLRCDSYRPGALRTVDIPKNEAEGMAGGIRRLSIPCVRDRIVQTAVAMVLGPKLEEEFEDASFAYRPGRSVSQAVNRVQMLHAAGYRHVVDADIAGFFDMIDHDRMMERLSESVTDSRLNGLIVLWLCHAAPQGRGLAQGSPLSPLLANLFLDRMDEVFSHDNARIVRFADDFLILVKRAADADDALRRAAILLERQGLELNLEKTRITDFDKGFRFLGHRFLRSFAIPSKAYIQEKDDIIVLMQKLAKADDRVDQIPVVEDEESLSAKGYAPGHRTLHVMQRGRRLGLRNQAFTVEEAFEDGSAGVREWREIIAIPHDRIDRIDIGPQADIDPKALRHIVATGTLCSFVDGHGTTRAHVAPALAPRAGRHLAQARLAIDPERRLELAKALVMGRVKGQRALLRKMLYGRDAAPAQVVDAIVQLKKIIGRPDSGPILMADDVDVVMGYEGYAAAGYWPAISALAQDSFRFSNRQRKGPIEPANIALNILAWLLHRDVGAAILQAGLHPGFGALHSIADRHDACIYDLMEEFRCYFIEGLFCYVTNRRILRMDMFSKIGGRWRIKSDGTAALIRAYENRMHGHARKTKGKQYSYGMLLLNQAQLLAAHAEGRAAYVPHLIDY